MALSIDQANTISSENFDKVIVQQAYDSSIFYAKIKKMNNFIRKNPGGVNFEFPIRYKKLGQGGRVSPRAQIIFESVDTRTAGTLYWSYQQDKTMLHWDDQVQNAGKAKIVDLISDKSEELKEDIVDTLNTALWSTSTPSTTAGSVDIQPIPYIVDSANTYAGVAVADASNWASTEDSTTTVLNLFGSGSLSYMVNQTTFGTEGVTLHITTRNLFSKFMSIPEANKMYEDVETANMGFKNLAFLGAPVVGDAYVPAGYWLGLNMNDWHINVQDSGTDGLEISEWKDLFAAGFPNALAKVAQWVGQVCCKRRKTNFKYSALDYTK